MIKSLIKQRKQGGFTLIELMVVIVIIGILVAIALPNFIGAQDRAKISSVKANMHTFQTIAETYAVDFGGVYAEDVATLNTAATDTSNTSAYWKDFNNPFTNATGAGGNGSYDDAPAVAANGSTNVGTGITAYTTFISNTGYVLYGGGKTGKTIKDKGQVFELSNS